MRRKTFFEVEQNYNLQVISELTILVNSFNSKGTITQILGPKYEIVSILWKALCLFSTEVKLFCS